ncbi:phosphate regulon sensor histidine kinase PhoR [Sneathiella chinensis]|uniref:Phosphate regulon sensor protein PhoR n=1 Tax=Sneathiella chinensis TaxID=349750 RepID=A0ABQ5U4A5_9PROT|nr:phosphate regulon sensor histidine kinase PhoR [Sneathiella chinensis]GLQ06571.1 histidine kinase [Sneathiella chinensis]
MAKMFVFIALVTAPVAIIAFWLVSQDLLALEYAILLTLTPVGPGVLIYNRLLMEVNALGQKVEHVTEPGFDAHKHNYSLRSGLLPVDDLLLSLRQHRRVLLQRINQAKSREEDTNFLFDMLPDPILVLDERRQINRFNKAAQEFFETATLEGDLTECLRHPALIRAVDGVLARQSEGEAVAFAIPGNVTRHLQAYVVSLCGDAGGEFRVIISLHDVTSAKRTEQMRVDFVANASHELRTPLAILIGAIETLQGPAAQDYKAYPRFLNMMHAQSRRMSQLIDDLLSLSHIEMHEHSRPAEKVTLNEVLQEVGDLIQSKATGLGKSIALDMPDDRVFVTGDKSQLAQVFTNLIDNALKYSRDNTEVSVRLEQRERDVLVSVIDQGEGIPKTHLPRLTERFYRVDSDRSREMGGTGLGLAIVKHILSRHRGNLEIESEMGKGSVFTVRLPLPNSVTI